MKNIQEDIKTGNFKQAYLLYGEEAYLKQQYKHKLVQALNPEDDTMNFNHYEGRNIDVKELIDLCETMPFFADRRVVLLEDTGFFKNKCDELADYMKELPDYLCLIFVENEVDKRNRMYKAVKAAGRIGEFVQQDEKTLMRWAAGLLKKEGSTLHTAGDTIANVRVFGGDTASVPLAAKNTVTAYLLPGEREKLQRVRYGEKICYAPVVRTAQAGSVEYRLGDCVMGRDTLVYGGESLLPAEEKGIVEKILERFTN